MKGTRYPPMATSTTSEQSVETKRNHCNGDRYETSRRAPNTKTFGKYPSKHLMLHRTECLALQWSWPTLNLPLPPPPAVEDIDLVANGNGRTDGSRQKNMRKAKGWKNMADKRVQWHFRY